MSEPSPEELERRQRIAQQTDEQYLALGRFIAKFELLMESTRWGVSLLLRRGGIREEQYSVILLAKVMAEDLCQIFFSMLAHDSGLAGINGELFDHIAKRLRSLNDHRNDLVHNALNIGWVSEADENLGAAMAFKRSRPKSGPKVQVLTYSTPDLMALGDEADEVRQLVSRVWSTLGSGSTFSQTFRKDGAAWVPVWMR